MSEIYLKRDNSVEVHFKLPDHQDVELYLFQKVNETIRRAFETLSRQFFCFPQPFGILRTLLRRLHHHDSDEEDPL